VRVGVVSPVITGVVLGDRRAAARDKLHGALRITGGAEGQPDGGGLGDAAYGRRGLLAVPGPAPVTA